MKKVIKILLTIVLLIFGMIIIFFRYQDISVEKLKVKYANQASSFVTIDGMEVHYRDEGIKSDSIPIVLIHGTGASLHTFDAWTDELKKTKRVIRMYLPAYGLTGPFPNRNYSMDNYVKFIKNFLAKLGVKKCVLAGNSLGGQIAWNFTATHATIVQKLILIDAAGYPTKSKSIPIAFKVAQTPILNKLLLYVTPRFLVKASVENVYFDKTKVTEKIVNRYFDLTLRKGNRKAFVDRLNMKKTITSFDKIKSIQQPTLILWGSEDLLIPVENAYKFQKDLPNNKLVILNKVGHTPMEESPNKGLLSVIGFIK